MMHLHEIGPIREHLSDEEIAQVWFLETQWRYTKMICSRPGRIAFHIDGNNWEELNPDNKRFAIQQWESNGRPSPSIWVEEFPENNPYIDYSEEYDDNYDDEDEEEEDSRFEPPLPPTISTWDPATINFGPVSYDLNGIATYDEI